LKSKLTRGANVLTLAIVVVALGSCGLPRSGPNKREIYSGSVLKQGDAFVVQVTPRVSQITAVAPSFGFGGGFRNAGLVGSDVISPGDTLSLTVFENVKEDPLLGNTGQRVTPLNQTQVDGQGYIFVPYAGKIRAAGQTPDGLRQAITRKLAPQTPDPQVTVQRVAGDGSSVSLSGSVNGPGVYPMELPTRTLATMLSKAGGISIDPAIALVRVTRGDQTGKVWLQDLYDNPSLDIALRAGDQIVVERDTRSFTALGATGQQNRVQFETKNLSAIEAIATVGGLSTGSADPTGVFILREESADIANAVLGRTDLVGDQRLAYVLDLTQPTGLFEARDFLVRDGDTVYVTEAPFVQWQKRLSALTGSVGAAQQLGNTTGAY
jgi:polysaccharide biosynthesis/export protein